MPPLDISGFVTPEQNFGGLYKAADRMEQNAYRDEQMRLRKQQIAESEKGKRAANAKFLMGYLDPKDHLSGSPYDPEIVKGFSELLAEGAALANEGVDANMLMMALAPKVNKLSEYATKAKLINLRLKDQFSKIQSIKGYDLSKLEAEARKVAFYDNEGKLKDLSTVDPNIDYLTETIKLYPDRVTTDAGFDDFVKGSPKYSNTKDITSYTPTGGMSRKKVNITSPNWMMPDTDARGATTGIVPKYQVALEDGQPLMHDFVDKDGKVTKAAVRLMDETEFDSMMAGNPGMADWVRGQVKKSAGGDIDLNSPQAKNLARAIVYDELKRRNPGSIQDVEIQNRPSAPEIRNYITGSYYAPRKSSGGSGGGNSELEINDVYSIIDEMATKKKSERRPYLQVNLLPAEAQSVVIDFARKLKGDNEISQEDIKIIKDNDGKIGIYDAGDNKLIGYLNATGTNLKVQPSVKEKREVIKKGNSVTKPKNDPLGLFD
jgi:hypothetical protein